jgi:hypothetical protein
MGVPIFNVFIGVLAGIYTTRKAVKNKTNLIVFKQNLRRTAWFCVSILFCICAGSAYIALKDPFTAGNLEGMLQLNFAVTQQIIEAIIIFGGFALLVLQYWIVYITGILTWRLSKQH